MDPRPSFAEFVTARSTALYRTALLLTGHSASAEDLLQDALERAYRRWDRIEVLEAPEAYVRRILVNLATDRWRRRRFTEQPLESWHEPATNQDAADQVAVRDSLTGALRRLTPRQRAVLVLRYWDGLTELETAVVMNCAVGTVKATAHQALARMRAHLAEHALSAVLTNEEVNDVD